MSDPQNQPTAEAFSPDGDSLRVSQYTRIMLGTQREINGRLQRRIGQLEEAIQDFLLAETPSKKALSSALTKGLITHK